MATTFRTEYLVNQDAAGNESIEVRNALREGDRLIYTEGHQTWPVAPWGDANTLKAEIIARWLAKGWHWNGKG